MTFFLNALTYATKQAQRRKRALLNDSIGYSVVALSLTLMYVSSGFLYQQAMVDTAQQIVFDMNVEYQALLSDAELRLRAMLLSSVEGVARTETVMFSVMSYGNSSPVIGVVALQEDSAVWNDFTFRTGTGTPRENQCLVVLDTQDASHYPLNSTVPVYIPYMRQGSTTVPYLPLDLNVTGLVSTGIDLSALLLEYSRAPGMISLSQPTVILLVNYNKTMAPILDYLAGVGATISPATLLTNTVVWLDQHMVQQAVVMGMTQSLVDTMKLRLSSALSGHGRFVVGSNLEGALDTLKQYYDGLSLGLFTSLIPMFFLAFVVLQLQGLRTARRRRHEVGLLRTKGYSSGFIRIAQTWESLLVAVLASIVGMLLGLLISVIFLSSGTVSLFSVEMVLVIVGITATITVYASRASYRSVHGHSLGMTAHDPSEEEQVSMSRFVPALCTALGLYKMIAWALDIAPYEILVASGGGLDAYLLFLLQVWLSIDSILNVLGPVLLLYGLARMASSSENVLYVLSGISTRLRGTIGTLASRNLSRHQQRNLQLALVLALTVGYASWTSLALDTTILQSQERALVDNGADVSFFIRGDEDTHVMQQVLSITAVEAITIERRFTLNTVTESISLRAVTPDTWESAAYSRPEWFTFADASKGLTLLDSNNTIVLERLVAARLGLHLGDTVSLYLENHSWSLLICGLFGPTPVPIVVQGFGGSSVEYYCERTWSYVGAQFCELLQGLILPQKRALVRVSDGAMRTEVASAIDALHLPVYQIKTSEETVSLQTRLATAMLSLRLVNVVFSVIISLLGVSALMLATRESRREEIRNMLFRGFGRSSIGTLLYWEIVPLMTFMLVGVLIGVFTSVGLSQSMFQGTQVTLVSARLAVGGFSAVFIPLTMMTCVAALRLACHVTKWRPR
ncbi:MAG: hypothetical protein HXY34_13110 [Candidatus Thorarchaeota archaeon]|nr:hypothetical protein [Candidatus Thorarchaeota archaeon]